MRISDWSSDVCSSDLGLNQQSIFILGKDGSQPPPVGTRPAQAESGGYFARQASLLKVSDRALRTLELTQIMRLRSLPYLLVTVDLFFATTIGTLLTRAARFLGYRPEERRVGEAGV